MRLRGRSRAGRPPERTRGNRASSRAGVATASPIDRENEVCTWVSHNLTEGPRASAYARLTLDVRRDDAGKVEAAGGDNGRTKDPHHPSPEAVTGSEAHA